MPCVAWAHLPSSLSSQSASMHSHKPTLAAGEVQGATRARKAGAARADDAAPEFRPEQQPAGSVSGRPHPVGEREPCPVRRSVRATETARWAAHPGELTIPAAPYTAPARSGLSPAMQVWSTGEPNEQLPAVPARVARALSSIRVKPGVARELRVEPARSGSWPPLRHSLPHRRADLGLVEQSQPGALWLGARPARGRRRRRARSWRSGRCRR